MELYTQRVLIRILKTLLTKVAELSLINIRITDNDRTIRNFITDKKLNLDLKLNLLLSTNHWLYVCNITKYQLRLIRQYFMNQMQLDCGMTLVRKLEQIYGDKMYMFENNLLKLVRLHAKVFQVTGATQIVAALSNTTSLNTIDIDNYSITNEIIRDLANILQNNIELQELHLNGNSLQANNAIKIAKHLYNISYLLLMM